MIRSTFRFSGSGEDFGPRADGLVTGHTTESPYNKLTVADAIVLARWQDRADIAGSYNDLICIDGILSCVPPAHASGGINPGSPAWAPKAWLYDLMSREMVNNPNYFTRNISFMGSRSWFDANGWPPQMIDNFVTVMLEEERRIGSRTILTQHMDFQTNRTDAGNKANALITARYLARTGRAMPQEDYMIRQPIVTEEWHTITGEPTRFTRPDGTTSTFGSVTRVKSIAEMTLADGTDARLLDYGSKHEALIIARAGLRPIAGTRIVGSPVGTTIEVIKEVPTGITQAQVTAAVAKAKTDERTRIATSESTRIKSI